MSARKFEITIRYNEDFNSKESHEKLDDFALNNYRSFKKSAYRKKTENSVFTFNDRVDFRDFIDNLVRFKFFSSYSYARLEDKL